MKISFDLDGVLFVDPNKYETEQPLPSPLNLIYPDRLRKGTVQLVHELQNQGFEVLVYTSSYRSELYIRALFLHYRIKFAQIINADKHNEEVQSRSTVQLPSKMPAKYQISLHIDDDEIVVKNGKTYGFRVLRINEPDPEWAEKVLKEANRVREIEIQQASDAEKQ
ncbi:MAG: HAD family hydrolase [Anaerolineaceae bacterium]|nr:HAD family hydrolase [Anaerolineaceae bacterium]